jgi:uncharacterized protein with HEPN domain
MRNDRERLLDVLEAIANIERRTSSGKAAFVADELLQIWVVHHIQIIGEASANVSPALRERHPGIPWADVVAMRNVLVHHYFGIDLQQVWDTVTTDLPKLKHDIETVLSELNAGPERPS